MYGRNEEKINVKPNLRRLGRKARRAAAKVGKGARNATDVIIIPTSVGLTMLGTGVQVAGSILSQAGLEVGKLAANKDFHERAVQMDKINRKNTRILLRQFKKTDENEEEGDAELAPGDLIPAPGDA